MNVNIEPIEPDEFWPQIWLFVKKFSAIIFILLGATLAWGRDLLERRKLTFWQKLGLLLVRLIGGVIGWLISLALNIDNNTNPTGAIIIVVFAAMGEKTINWIDMFWPKFLHWLASFMRVNKKPGE